MQHIDNFCNDQQIVRRNIQPGIECLDELAAYFIAWFRGNESERLKDDLYIVQSRMIDKYAAKNATSSFEPTKFFLQIEFEDIIAHGHLEIVQENWS